MTLLELGKEYDTSSKDDFKYTSNSPLTLMNIKKAYVSNRHKVIISDVLFYANTVGDPFTSEFLYPIVFDVNNNEIPKIKKTELALFAYETLSSFRHPPRKIEQTSSFN